MQISRWTAIAVIAAGMGVSGCSVGSGNWAGFNQSQAVPAGQFQGGQYQGHVAPGQPVRGYAHAAHHGTVKAPGCQPNMWQRVTLQKPKSCAPAKIAPVRPVANAAVKCPPPGVAVHQAAIPRGCVPARTYAVAQSAPATYVSGGPRHGYGSAPGYGAHAQAASHPAGGPALRGFYQPYDAYAYGGIGGVLYDAQAEAAGIVGRVGYQTGNFFGAEIEGSFGVKSEDTDLDFIVFDDDDNIVRDDLGNIVTESQTLEQEVVGTIGGYAVGRIPLTPSVALFGRGGYVFGTVRDELDAFDFSDETHVEGVSYGGGLEYLWDPKNGLRADYTRTDFKDNNGSFDSVSVSYVRRF